MKDDAYIQAARTAMLKFQMVEEALKICIGLSHEIISITTPSPVQFKVNTKSISSAPLGKLITMYEVVSSNHELAKELRKLTNWRNYFAHNAFRHELYARAGNSPFAKHSVEDVQQVLCATKDAVERLGREVQELQALYRSIAREEFSGSLDVPK